MRPLTGKPDAGKPPVRFGGRGKVNPLFLPLSTAVPSALNRYGRPVNWQAGSLPYIFRQALREQRGRMVCLTHEIQILRRVQE